MFEFSQRGHNVQADDLMDEAVLLPRLSLSHAHYILFKQHNKAKFQGIALRRCIMCFQELIPLVLQFPRTLQFGD